MKNDILKQYTKLRTSLEQERAEVQSRLQEIEAALGGTSPAPAATPVRRGPGRPKGTKAKRKLSPANKAKLIAGIKARWARYRAEKGIEPAAKKIAPKPKRKISAVGKKAIAAAARARWAKVRAEKAAKK